MKSIGVVRRALRERYEGGAARGTRRPDGQALRKCDDDSGPNFGRSDCQCQCAKVILMAAEYLGREEAYYNV